MDETAIAFDLPHVRAAATELGEPLDRISVRDYTRAVEIGAFLSERGQTQSLRFNVVLEVSHHAAAEEDDVDQVVSYDTITEAIEQEISAARINLLETLADRIAARCLADARARRVFVRIEKLDRIPGALGVEIVRRRLDEGVRRLRPAEPPVRPIVRHRVVYLDPGIAAGPAAHAWREALAALGAPLVVVVGPKAPQPPATGEAERRIGLLAMEQAAWAFAGSDGRFHVVGSRTELDWAPKAGQMTVWAPSHMVTAVLNDVVPDASDPVALAGWLAGRLQATLVVAGAPAPDAGATADVPADLAALAAAGRL